MVTEIRPTETQTAAEAQQFVPLLPAKYALNPYQASCVMLGGLLLMYFSYIPLFHSDIWGHVSYGAWILDHRALPTIDPFTPLAEGVTLTDTAWLGQVLFAAAARQGGPHWVSHLFALTVFLTYVINVSTFSRRSGSLLAGTLSCVLAFVVGFSRHAIVRPEVFGGLCLAALFWLIARAEPERPTVQEASEPHGVTTKRNYWWLYLGVALVQLAWANLHGSFIIGLAILGCVLAGRVLEVLWKTQEPWQVLQDAQARRWLLVLETGIAVTLINPYGIGLFLNVFQFSSNPNLKDVLEWFPLSGTSLEGIHFIISMVVLVVLFRHSRRPISAADVLLLCLFGLAVAPTIRMIGWYAIVVTYVLAPHVGELLPRVWPEPFKPRAEPVDARTFHWSVGAALALWVAFAFSPVSQPVLGGKVRTDDHVYSRDTPRGISKYLREHPPQGQIFNPQWWGDWLAWDGPKSLKVFMTTNAVHLTPSRVWKDYMQVARAEAGWDLTLDRYDVNTLVLHKELQAGLWRAVRRSGKWQVAYDDKVGVVYVRGRELAALNKRKSEEAKQKANKATATTQSSKTTKEAS